MIHQTKLKFAFWRRGKKS